MVNERRIVVLSINQATQKSPFKVRFFVPMPFSGCLRCDVLRLYIYAVRPMTQGDVNSLCYPLVSDVTAIVYASKVAYLHLQNKYI